MPVPLRAAAAAGTPAVVLLLQPALSLLQPALTHDNTHYLNVVLQQPQQPQQWRQWNKHTACELEPGLSIQQQSASSKEEPCFFEKYLPMAYILSLWLISKDQKELGSSAAEAQSVTAAVAMCCVPPPARVSASVGSQYGSESRSETSRPAPHRIQEAAAAAGTKQETPLWWPQV